VGRHLAHQWISFSWPRHLGRKGEKDSGRWAEGDGLWKKKKRGETRRGGAPVVKPVCRKKKKKGVVCRRFRRRKEEREAWATEIGNCQKKKKKEEKNALTSSAKLGKSVEGKRGEGEVKSRELHLPSSTLSERKKGGGLLRGVMNRAC